MAIGHRPFRVELLTPAGRVEPVECTFAALAAWDGEIGILSGRAPLACRLKAGALRLEVEGRWRWYYVQGGFADVLGNVVTVLTERAVPAEDLSAEDAEADLDTAIKMRAHTEQARLDRQEKIDQAHAQMALIRKLASSR